MILNGANCFQHSFNCLVFVFRIWNVFPLRLYLWARFCSFRSPDWKLLRTVFGSSVDTSFINEPAEIPCMICDVTLMYSPKLFFYFNAWETGWLNFSTTVYPFQGISHKLLWGVIAFPSLLRYKYCLLALNSYRRLGMKVYLKQILSLKCSKKKVLVPFMTCH